MTRGVPDRACIFVYSGDQWIEDADYWNTYTACRHWKIAVGSSLPIDALTESIRLGDLFESSEIDTGRRLMLALRSSVDFERKAKQS